MFSRAEERAREDAYRIYMTDALKVIGGLNLRYAEYLEPPTPETRTEEEIVSHINNGLKKLKN